MTGLKLREMKSPEVCCGFGGTFCVKYPEISNAMVGEKSADIAGAGADTLLAGMGDQAPIGEPDSGKR